MLLSLGPEMKFVIYAYTTSSYWLMRCTGDMILRLGLKGLNVVSGPHLKKCRIIHSFPYTHLSFHMNHASCQGKFRNLENKNQNEIHI